MEPLTALVTAIALGAAAGLKDTAERAIKDSYGASGLSFSASTPKLTWRTSRALGISGPQGRCCGGPAAAGAIGDEEVIEQAEALLSEIEKHAPEAALLSVLTWRRSRPAPSP